MDMKEVGRQLAKLGLPLLGAALPIPGGAVLGATLARLIGPDANGTVPTRADDLLARLTQDADALQRAREFEAKHAETMMRLKLDDDQRQREAADADRADARKRDTAMIAAGVSNKRANWMVALDVVGLLACLAGMMGLGWFKAAYPNEITEGTFSALLVQLSTLASFFGLCLRDAHQFEFGSSRGSRDKDALVVAGRNDPGSK
jgi:hypothetical protein